MKLASQRQDRLFADATARRSLHVIEDWATTTRDGTASTLPPLERPGIWDKVQSDSGNCMGRKCPTYKQCFYQAARAKIDGANLFITNHALFFADLNLRAQDAGILPDYDHVILDEAHAVEETASEHFGVSLAEGRVMHLLTSLAHPRTGKGYLPYLSLSIDSDAMAAAVRCVDAAMLATRAFFDELRGLTHAASGGGDAPWTHREAEPRSVRVRAAGAVTNILTPAMRDLSLRLKSLRDAVKNDEDRFELNAFAIRTEGTAVAAETLVSQTLLGYAYWVETENDREERFGSRATHACAPIDVAPILRERLFRQKCSVVLTSATLATRTVRDDEAPEKAETAFAHIISRLGCEGARALQLGSPFDYARQMKVYIERGGGGKWQSGKVREWQSDDGMDGRESLSPLSAVIMRHIEATQGGAFVLFTSFSALNKCASELAGPLSVRGYPMLAQGRDGSRTTILQRFRESNKSVLLGAASFWQGVDVRGDALRNVIIAKLPFDPPDRPLTQARYELIEAKGGNPFMEDSLPRAVIKFKQGIGRLIRSKTDTGRVVILDERVKTARYGRLFLAALPEGARVVTDDE